jgi:hypothetical protein
VVQFGIHWLGGLDETIPMTGWREPKEPLDIPKSIHLRERARNLKGQAEGLLKKADSLLAEAERVEVEEPQQKK